MPCAWSMPGRRGAVGNEDGCLLVDTSVAADEPTQAQTYTMAERREQGWYARLAILRIALALMRAGFPASRISSPGKCHSQVSFPGVIFPGQFSDPHFFHANWVPEYRKNGFFLGVIFSACFHDTYGSYSAADFMTLIVGFCRMVSTSVESCRRAALLRSGAALRRLRFQSLGTSQTRRTGRSKAKAACRGQQTAFYSVVMPSRETAPIVPLAKVHHLWYYSTDD